MSDAVELLQQLGFGEYEAKAYIALLQQSPLNGYELAKASCIPRANIYGVLQRLEERHAVSRIEAEGSLRYTPVPPAQLIPEMDAHFQHILSDTQNTLEKLTVLSSQELSRNISGYDSILDQARVLISGARDNLFIALWHREAPALASSIAQVDPQVRIVTLCMQACGSECGSCAGTIFRYHVVPKQDMRWIMVVQDNHDMLMGEIGSDQALALRTNQHSLIQMAVQFMQSQIAWAAVLDRPGNLEQALSPDAMRVLHEIRPNGMQADWLSFMRSVLKREI